VLDIKREDKMDIREEYLLKAIKYAIRNTEQDYFYIITEKAIKRLKETVSVYNKSVKDDRGVK